MVYFKSRCTGEATAESQIICTGLDSCQLVNTSLIKNILVPFDNSKHATRAFGHALDLARKYNSSIIVITVTDENQTMQWLNDTPSRQKSVNKSRNSEFKRIFKTLESHAAKFQIHFEAMILESNTIAESIISFATKKNIDYIVMGTHGNGMVKEMMLGRISTNIALNAHCPVVLVK
ncbi:MAG: universal stress protein [Candidatus Nitrosotenuis sp.]|nr:MAG: universal stress protein [Candidatus Nitrosotenuis sp.]